LAKMEASGITQAQRLRYKHNLHKSHGHIKAFYHVPLGNKHIPLILMS
jgi:hypothetical protein